MAKEIKKASLLTEAERQKLLKKAGTKKPVPQAQTAAVTRPVVSRSASRAKTEQASAASGSIKAKVWSGLVILLVAAFIVAPKPQLLEYQSAGLITQSIYMPGLFGKPGVILDTNQRAILAEDEQSLYLCFDGQSNEQCARYQLRKQQGIFAAAFFWYSSRP